MAYVPPHKRHSKDEDKPLPTPAFLDQQFQNKLNLSSSLGSKSRSKKGGPLKAGKIIYARNAIHKWFIEGSLADDDQLPADSIRMEPFYYESLQWKRGGESFVLVCDSVRGSSALSSPWVSIIENIQPELHASLRNVRNEMDLGEQGAVVMSAKIGKILFQGNVSISLTSRSAAETALSHVRRSFYTNLPDSYMEAILGGVFPKIGVDLYHVKEYYHVKVFDKCNPESSISIKCQAICGELKIYKIELEQSQMRCFVADVSCLGKDFDQRLMLSTKRGPTTAIMDDVEKLTSLKHLVEGAILDGNVRGGLRWPQGKEYSPEGRYCVVGVWHTNVKTFKNSSMKVRCRNADRFDFRTSTGEISNELTLDMRGINESLMAGMVETETINAILQDTMKLVWDHFLSCDRFLFLILELNL